MRINASSVLKRNSANVLANSVLPTPVGSKENKRADRLFGFFQAGTRTSDGAADGRNRLILAPRRAYGGIFHAQELVRLLLFELEERNARPVRHDVGDVFFADRRLLFLLILFPFALGFIEQLPETLLLFAVPYGLLEVLIEIANSLSRETFLSSCSIALSSPGQRMGWSFAREPVYQSSRWPCGRNRSVM